MSILMDDTAFTRSVSQHAVSSYDEQAPRTGTRRLTARDTTLRGRDFEFAQLAHLLRDVRAGESRVLLITGETGVGKSALLGRLAEKASGCTVIRVVNVPSEAEFAFAALHQLCRPLLDQIEQLPEPQQAALEVTFGVRLGSAPDPLLLGVSVLSLLTAAAAECPLVCVVDDAQWLDSASASVLQFIARRLAGASIGLVFARRDDDDTGFLEGADELAVRGLPEQDAHALLEAAIPGPLDPKVRERIVAETRGNPLAILELPRGMTPEELAGGFGVMFNLSGRVEAAFRRRLADLPANERRLALLAAAEPLGDPDLLRRAATRLRIPVDTVDPAHFDGLLQWGSRVVFRHPLVRSAMYQTAPPAERRETHQALADVTDPVADPDRRAWHLSYAVSGPNEMIALELENSAGRAEARGGLAAAAAFFERASNLTPDPTRRAIRALVAAEYRYRGGAAHAALDLLTNADSWSLDALRKARVDLIRARAEYVMNGGADVPALLLNAAARLQPLDRRLARDSHLEALSAAQTIGWFLPGGVVAAAEAVRLASEEEVGSRAQDDLLAALSAFVTEGYTAGAGLVRRALTRFNEGGLSDEDAMRWNWLACRAAAFVWDYPSLRTLSNRMAELARASGSLGALAQGLAFKMLPSILGGQLDVATALADELTSTVKTPTAIPVSAGLLQLHAWRGYEAEAEAFCDLVEREASARAEGMGVAAVHMSRAILCNALGRHDDALAAAGRGADHPEGMVFHNWSLSELVEAAVRCGRRDLAADALERLSDRTTAAGGDWALGMEARCRALVSEGDEAERLYRESVERLERTEVNVELARAHLLFGEWLRRQRRRLEARGELRRAFTMFTSMGLVAFAERARRELAATGETSRRRTAGIATELTAQELQVARMAGEGLSNPEIGTRLFLSGRTVQYHLHKVFTKLGISSRVQLADALGPARDSGDGH